MAQASKRLEFLLKMTSSSGSSGSTGSGASPGGGSRDPFVWYGLAMEYRSLQRNDEALATFEELRKISPDYVPMYLMCGQMLESMARAADARTWLTAGIEAARRKGDSHAASELEAALSALG